MNPNQFCCAQFHNRDWPPCRGCLVQKGLEFTRSQWEKEPARLDRIFYSPVFTGNQRVFKYMHVWAEPVFARDGSEPAIAVVESVIDLTDSPTIQEMSLEENLDILIRAITELTCGWLEPAQVPIRLELPPVAWEKLDKRPGYTRVRVYRPDTDSAAPVIRLLRHSADHAPSVDEKIVFRLFRTPEYPPDASPGQRAVWVEDPAKFMDVDVPNRLVGCSEVPLEFSLFDDKRQWIGWLAIDAEGDRPGTRKLGPSDVTCLRPYAEEIACILQRKLGAPRPVASDTSRIFEEAKSRIVLARTIEDALQSLIEAVVGRRGIEMGHIRMVAGDQLKMAAGSGFYYDHGAKQIPLTSPHSLSTRVARSGIPLIVNDRPDQRVEDSIADLHQDLRAELESIRSVAVFPLQAFGETEGVLALQSRQRDVFTSDTVLLCSKLAELASFALHDTSLQAETEKKTSEIWREAAAAFAHSIGNSLSVTQYRLKLISLDASAPAPIKEDAVVALAAANRAMAIASGFRQGGSGVRVKLKIWTVLSLIEQIRNRCQDQHSSVKIVLVLRRDRLWNVKVRADLEALGDVFLSFVADSIRFHPANKPAVTIECTLDDRTECVPQVLVRYADDGPGVPDELKEKIFDPFFTTHPSGNGIGLAHARNVVRAHGGTLRESGRKGTGICLEMTLPVLVD